MKCLYCLSFADIDRGNTFLRNTRTYPALAIVFILRYKFVHFPSFVKGVLVENHILFVVLFISSLFYLFIEKLHSFY